MSTKTRHVNSSGDGSCRLLSSIALALAVIFIGLHVFDSAIGFLVVEAALGGFAGAKFRTPAVPGAVAAFLAWVAFELIVNHHSLRGEDGVIFLILLAGVLVFSSSALAGHILMKKLERD